MKTTTSKWKISCENFIDIKQRNDKKREINGEKGETKINICSEFTEESAWHSCTFAILRIQLRTQMECVAANKRCNWIIKYYIPTIW